MKNIVFATAALLALPVAALAQTQPAAPNSSLDEAAATQLLTEWGFTDIRLDDRDDGYFEYDARASTGQSVEIELGFDGQLLKLDLDNDADVRGVGLVEVLPAEVQSTLNDRGIVDIREFEAGRSAWKVEGYNSEGREIEIEIAYAASASGATAPDLNAVVQAVESAGYVVNGEPVAKNRHVEIQATNPEGEPVTLHADFEGVVYRELLRR